MLNIIQNQITHLIHITVGKIAVIESINFEKEADQTRICILTQNNSIFLENRCEVLEAIQHYIRKIVHIKNPIDRSHFFLDIGYYNKNRESHPHREHVPWCGESAFENPLKPLKKLDEQWHIPHIENRQADW